MISKTLFLFLFFVPFCFNLCSTGDEKGPSSPRLRLRDGGTSEQQQSRPPPVSGEESVVFSPSPPLPLSISDAPTGPPQLLRSRSRWTSFRNVVQFSQHMHHLIGIDNPWNELIRKRGSKEWHDFWPVPGAMLDNIGHTVGLVGLAISGGDIIYLSFADSMYLMGRMSNCALALTHGYLSDHQMRESGAVRYCNRPRFWIIPSSLMGSVSPILGVLAGTVRNLEEDERDKIAIARFSFAILATSADMIFASRYIHRFLTERNKVSPNFPQNRLRETDFLILKRTLLARILTTVGCAFGVLIFSGTLDEEFSPLIYTFFFLSGFTQMALLKPPCCKTSHTVGVGWQGTEQCHCGRSEDIVG